MKYDSAVLIANAAHGAVFTEFLLEADFARSIKKYSNVCAAIADLEGKATWPDAVIVSEYTPYDFPVARAPGVPHFRDESLSQAMNEGQGPLAVAGYLKDNFSEAAQGTRLYIGTTNPAYEMDADCGLIVFDNYECTIREPALS